jgi:hypothetical protein
LVIIGFQFDSVQYFGEFVKRLLDVSAVECKKGSLSLVKARMTSAHSSGDPQAIFLRLPHAPPQCLNLSHLVNSKVYNNQILGVEGSEQITQLNCETKCECEPHSRSSAQSARYK